MSPDLHPGDEAIHDYFSLSYANSLVLPRTFLQSMPGEWQQRFVQLVNELEAAFEDVPKPSGYHVQAGQWEYPNVMDPDTLERLGWALSEDGREAIDPDGNAHDAGLACVFVPEPDPVPHYGRGRTRLIPRAPAGPHQVPTLTDAFTVRAGLVLIRGLAVSLVIPEGCCWPGLEALPAAWIEDLSPHDLVLVPGTRCDLTLIDRPAGLGLIRAQLLSRGPVTQRLRVLEELTPPGELLREHLGEIVDYSYRTARRTLNDMTGGNG